MVKVKKIFITILLLMVSILTLFSQIEKSTATYSNLNQTIYLRFSLIGDDGTLDVPGGWMEYVDVNSGTHGGIYCLNNAAYACGGWTGNRGYQFDIITDTRVYRDRLEINGKEFMFDSLPDNIKELSLRLAWVCSYNDLEALSSHMSSGTTVNHGRNLSNAQLAAYHWAVPLVEALRSLDIPVNGFGRTLNDIAVSGQGSGGKTDAAPNEGAQPGFGKSYEDFKKLVESSKGVSSSSEPVTVDIDNASASFVRVNGVVGYGPITVDYNSDENTDIKMYINGNEATLKCSLSSDLSGRDDIKSMPKKTGFYVVLGSEAHTDTTQIHKIEIKASQGGYSESELLGRFGFYYNHSSIETRNDLGIGRADVNGQAMMVMIPTRPNESQPSSAQDEITFREDGPSTPPPPGDSSIHIEKRDSVTGNLIDTATFVVEYDDVGITKSVDQNGNLVDYLAKLKTSGGKIDIHNVPAEKFTVREVEAPEGYSPVDMSVFGGSGTFEWPVQGQNTPAERAGNITSLRGDRQSPGGIGSTHHQGMDIACATGTPILAASGGTVTELGNPSHSMGNYVKIEHDPVDGHRFVAYYGHNSQILVNVGQRVEKGQIISYAGSTGNSTGPHLHFECYIGDGSLNSSNVIDPLHLYTPDQVSGVTRDNGRAAAGDGLYCKPAQTYQGGVGYVEVEISAGQEYTFVFRNIPDGTPPPGRFTPGTFKKVIKSTDVPLEGFEFTIREETIEVEYPEYICPQHGVVHEWEHKGPSGRRTVWHTWYDEEGDAHRYSTTEIYYTTDEIKYNAMCDAINPYVRQAMQCYNNRKNGLNSMPNPLVTDEKGTIDITPLCPSGDDGKGLFYMRETSVGSNPYFNVDGTEFQLNYTKDNIRENERMRMDIEGLIWEDINESKEGDNPQNSDGIYGTEGDQLLFPIEVKLMCGGTQVGESVVTGDGRYRIRVGGANGENRQYFTDPALKSQLYVEFVYNGMKYQSVHPATIGNEENGSKALEAAITREDFNRRFTTIVSNAGALNSNKNENQDTTINFKKNNEDKYDYKRKVIYEGDVQLDGKSFTDEAADPIGNGKYSGYTKMPKANEIDPNTQQKEANGDTSIYSNDCYKGGSNKESQNKYQITANTWEAGYKGFENYTVADDKIEHVNLGVYKREQPDLSVLNDIERVVVKLNNESYLYQYGGKTADTEDLYQKGVAVRFQNNVNYKYKRYIRAEQIEIGDESTLSTQNSSNDPFRVYVYYKTVIKNESTNLTILPEVRSLYDDKYKGSQYGGYDLEDKTDEVANDLGISTTDDTNGMKATKVIWNNPLDRSKYTGATSSAEAGVYKQAYGILSDSIRPGKQAVFYTRYTLGSKDLKSLIEVQESTLDFYNTVEINAYTTTYPDQERHDEIGEAYAGIDIDSVAGNCKPAANGNDDGNETCEDDNDAAPGFEMTATDPISIKGNVFEDIRDEECELTLEPGDKRNGLEPYLGNGYNDSENAVTGVLVELVELDDNGDEILDDNGRTKVLLDKDAYSNHETEKAITEVKPDGSYEFVGFIPGEYIVKFTWGQEVTYRDPNNEYKENVINSKIDDGDNDPSNDDIAYVQQYKSTNFYNEERYSNMVDLSTPVDKDSTVTLTDPDNSITNNRWYLGDDPNKPETAKHYQYSNAIDNTDKRAEIDSQIVNTGNNYLENNYLDTNLNNDSGDVDNSNMITYPDLEDISSTDTIFGNRSTFITSYTPAFDVGLENTNRNREDKENKQNEGVKYEPIKIEGLDFGIVKRPKQQMDLVKRVERVKIQLANKNVVIDAEVDKETGTLKGNVKNATNLRPDPTTSYIGLFKAELDKEVLQGATLEITYGYEIKNESNLDFVVTGEGYSVSQDLNKVEPYKFRDSIYKNRYYKYGETNIRKVKDGGAEEVEMSPTIIIDYLDNSMGFEKAPTENAPVYNDLWEEITEEENGTNYKTGLFSKLLYNGRYNNTSKLYLDNYNEYPEKNIQQNQIENIYKLYKTIIRNTTNEHLEDIAPDSITNDIKYYEVSSISDFKNSKKVQIYLKAKESSEDDVKFLASKVLSDTNVDLNFYNSAEIAQLNRTGGAIPDLQIPGNSDPTATSHTLPGNQNFENNTNYSKTKEKDGGWASLVSIVPPTGEDTNYTIIAWITLGASCLGILAAGIVLIKKLVLDSRKI